MQAMHCNAYAMWFHHIAYALLANLTGCCIVILTRTQPQLKGTQGVKKGRQGVLTKHPFLIPWDENGFNRLAATETGGTVFQWFSYLSAGHTVVQIQN